MAKVKFDQAHDGKKARTISTAAVFKKHKGDTAIKHGRQCLTNLRALSSPTKLKRKHKPKAEHPLSTEFSGAVETSRKSIEEKTLSQLDNARDGLIAQARSIMQQARDRMQKVDEHSNTLQKPLKDELLEVTRKNGSITTTTLGKRMGAYREFFNREEKKLEGLFVQWAEVSKQINDFAVEFFGPAALEKFLKDPSAGVPEPENADHRALMAALEAEKKRVQDTALSAGERAIEAMKANEKASLIATFPTSYQLCLRDNITCRS